MLFFKFGIFSQEIKSLHLQKSKAGGGGGVWPAPARFGTANILLN